MKQTIALSIFVAAGCAYFTLFVPPLTPVINAGDSFIFLENALRMTRGQRIYRDYFQFTLPGTETLYYSGLVILESPVWVLTLTLLSAVVAWCTLSVRATQHLVPRTEAFLPAGIFVAVYLRWVEATHHLYSSLAVMAALVVLMPRRNSRRIALAGALCAVATVFTQTRGPIAAVGLSAFIFLEQSDTGVTGGRPWRPLAVLWGAFSVTLGLLCAPFVLTAGPRRLWECTVTFPLTYYSALADVNSPSSAVAHWLGRWDLKQRVADLLVLTPLSAYAFGVHRLRTRTSRGTHEWNRVALVICVGLSQIFSVAYAPLPWRILPILMPALILTAWITSTSRQTHIKWALWLMVGLGVVTTPLQRVLQWSATVKTPVGVVATRDRSTYELWQWLSRNTHDGDRVYAPGLNASAIHVLFAQTNPSIAPFLLPTDYTRPEQVAQTVAALTSGGVTYILWDPRSLDDCAVAGQDHLGPLRAIRDRYYRLCWSQPSGMQAWRLDDQPPRSK